MLAPQPFRLNADRFLSNQLPVDDESFLELFLEGIEFVNNGTKGGDPTFRLEKYLISWVCVLSYPSMSRCRC